METITENMLQYILQPTDTKLVDLKTAIKTRPYLFLVAAAQTTPEEWGNRRFAVYIDNQRVLPAFLTQDEAVSFAVNHQCTIEGKPLVTKASQTNFSRMVAEYKQSNLMADIMVFSKVPIGIKFKPDEFPYETQKPAEAIMNEQFPLEKKWAGVEDVKRALDTYEANARKKLDPGARYENFSTLIQSLTQQNNIDPNDLDKILGMPAGYTRMLFTEVHTAIPAQKVVLKYLSYFGLSQYLYLYAKNCPEIRNYLRNHDKIDQYKLKPSPVINAKRFKLEGIQRGTANGFYVYRLKIVSKSGPMEIIVSNPLNLQIGREYQLMDGNGDTRKMDQGQKHEADRVPNPSDTELLAMAKELEERGKRGTKEPIERSYTQKRKDDIIAYFRKKERNINTKSAEAKFKALEVEEDILDEFYKYIQKHQTGSVEVQGYTARRLFQETTLTPYDAYLTLIRLRSDPKGTIQWLHDPQNQKQPKGGGK